MLIYSFTAIRDDKVCYAGHLATHRAMHSILIAAEVRGYEVEA